MKTLTIHHYPGGGEYDFFGAVEGEIAIPPRVCDNPNCGCDRSHGGLNSHGASSTLMVREVALDFDDLVTACVGFLEAAGWADLLDGPDEVKSMARELIDGSVETAAEYAPGTVLRPLFDRERDEWHFTEVT